MILLIEKRLQDKFGTCNTFCKVKEGVMEAMPWPIMEEKVSSTTFTFGLPESIV